MGEHTLSRRNVLRISAAAGVTTVIAGCLGDDDGGVSVEPGTTVVFAGLSSQWEGKEPVDIDGMENPTLILEDGGEYEIGWDEGDGAPHNIAIHDEDGNRVDGLYTDTVPTPDEDQFLTFEASPEMAVYICEPHLTDMVGDIVVE